MNPILQKRIEEAANITVQNLYDYAKQTRNPKASAYSEGYLDAIDVQGDFLFREGANYALSNQWISVEEALPIIGKDGYVDVFIIIKKNKKTLTYTARFEDNKFWNIDGFGVYQGVTHWMEIPSLEGGEK